MNGYEGALCLSCLGCIDDDCDGCGRRWCNGTYMGEGCDRCTYGVAFPLEGAKFVRYRPCAGDRGHAGSCHWDPHLAGLQ